MYFEAVCRDIRGISNICFTKHDHQLVKQVFFNYIKCKRSPKITKLVEVSCDHIWRCLGFRHRTSQLARKLLNFLPQPLHAMTRHLNKFHDFRTSFAFYIIKKLFFNKFVVMFRETDVRNFTNVPAHSLKIHSKTWIPFFQSLNSNISCTCSSNLLFSEKMQVNKINSRNIAKSYKKVPNFNMCL